MEKPISVLPNFTIFADKKDNRYYYELPRFSGGLLCYCEKVSDSAYVSVFRITPESFWSGMNMNGSCDFIKMLQDYSEGLPENVLVELKKFESKFGKIRLVSEDTIQIDDPNLLKEVLNSTLIKGSIYKTEGNKILFHEVSFVDLKTMFEKETGYPIKIENPEMVREVFCKLSA